MLNCLFRAVLVILVVVTVVVCQVRRRRRLLRVAEEESAVPLPRKRKEDANSCEVIPDLERGEGVVADENLDIETVTEEEEMDKSKVSFNLLLPLAIVDGGPIQIEHKVVYSQVQV